MRFQNSPPSSSNGDTHPSPFRWRLPGADGVPGGYSRIAILLPSLVLALALVGGAVVARLTDIHNRALAAGSLSARAGEMTEDLRQQLTLYQYGLRGARGAAVVAGPDSLTVDQFRRYSQTRSLEKEFRGAAGFGIVRRVPIAEEEAFVGRERRGGRPGFRVWELSPHDGEHAVIQFVEPEGVNATAVGLDIASEPARHAAAIAAMRSGEPRLTAPISLVQAPEDQGGFLLLLPIYRQGADPGTPDAREAATVGWAYTPFLISKMIAGSELMRADVGFTVSDVTDGAGAAPFYQTPVPAIGFVDALVHDDRLSIFGRQWLIHYRATPLLRQALNLTPPLLAAGGVGVTGVLLALLSHLYMANRARRLAAGQEQARQTDMLEREVKARTADLAQREARFKTLTELSTDWYWETDADGRFTAVSQGVSRIGQDHQSLIGKTRRELSADAQDPRLEQYEDFVRRGQPFRDLRYDLIGNDGALRHIVISGTPILDAAGACVGYRGSGRDVTEQLRSEEALRATSSRLALATKASGIAIWEYDVATGHLDWDDQMFQLYGARRDGEDCFSIWWTHCHPDDTARVAAEFQRVLEGGADLDTEFRVVRADGGARHVKGASITDRDADGRPIRIIGVNWDITEVRDREAALVAAQAAAEAASRAKTDFLANMSHEIRTPMNAVLGLTQLLAESRLSPQQRDFVTKISSAGRGLMALINDILDFSKVEAGQLDLEHAEFQLPDLVDGLVSLVSVNADEKKLALASTIAPHTPALVVGDRLRLQQILLNLLGNAIKFTQAGSVMLDVRVVAWPRPDRVALRFSVTDSGIGIPAHAIPTLFSAFTQADSSTTRRYGGSGLGLAISKRLVTLMGGEIGVESQPGAGSTFWFIVPLDVASPSQAAGQANRTVPPPGAAASAPRSRRPKRLKGLRLLMVEDNSINQEVGRLILEREGANVTIAADGAQALARLRARPGSVDLVLMDMQMPVMDGYEATRLIRQEPGLGTLPVVALTAGVLDAERARAYAAGITDFMTKPFDLDQMVATILRHVPKVAAPRQDRVVAAAAPSPAPLARLRAILPDLDERLEAMGLEDNEDLYLGLIERFVREFADAAQDLRQAVVDGRPADAAHRLHTLRGAAGQIAPRGLVTAVAAAEHALAHQNWAVWDASLNILATAVGKLAAAVR
ncbi:CHASE domain-containing protein [Nitrospirillum sp. BR 11163]|uniref:CHASE domain-containing protein n=1 Tax=Nitrospirillum sp. BR 11163 TaxID=3104323 RepID=UPI002AFE4BD6|nr:CHASE domain-containing protein [Nitrospirillum sp. BR 11163]MEA1676255.1 CHASE domain-containing protein [Nitrospirillum sp. BR 11163]